MTITRETLELAALAAGRRVAMAAARLAVRLGVLVSVEPFAVIAQSERTGDVLLTHNGTETDKERAYCEAITLCAARFRRQMKEAK